MRKQIQEQTENWKHMSREERGVLIAKSYKIEKTERGWKVPSQTGSGHYIVKFNGHEPECNCPDCQLTNQKCKHIYAVEFYVKKEIDQEGNITLTKGMKVTYGQKWSAYDKAQTNEKLVFMKLLRNLCDNIEQPEYTFGRPALPLSDMVFGSAMKIYSTFSLRRFMSDVKIAQDKGYISKTPCYASIGHFLQREDITPILKDMIKISSLPLSSVDVDFAIDSSGFGTSRFARYFDYKWGKERKHRLWLKAHVCCGIKSNIITSVEITDGESNDCPKLPNLVNETSDNFNISEVSADKAYSSRANLLAIEEVGAKAFIPFKKNATAKPKSCAIWKKMYHYFVYKHDEFLEHYHKRSNVESVFNMIKTKFRDNLRSKTKTAQINELLLKILCHNICVVIQEMAELDIKGEFVVEHKQSF